MDENEKKDTSEKEAKESVKKFDINLNEFGEIRSNVQIEDLNKYLNEHLEDKKLKDRADIGEEE